MTFNKFKLFSFLIVTLLIVSCKNNKQKEEIVEIVTQLKFEANWESIKANYKDPTWFNKQKFGIFIHWEHILFLLIVLNGIHVKCIWKQQLFLRS